MLTKSKVRSKKSLFFTSKIISKKYKRTRQKRNDGLKFIKPLPLHPGDRLTRNVKFMSSDTDVTFIKEVSLHPRD